MKSILVTQAPGRVIRAPDGAPRVVRVPGGQTRVVTAGVPGPQGERGAAGPSGAGLNVTFPTPLSEWLVSHNLGYRPAVQTFTAGGQEVDGAVLHLNLNQTLISFAGPLAGTARLV